jgi:hypothetical protein
VAPGKRDSHRSQQQHKPKQIESRIFFIPSISCHVSFIVLYIFPNTIFEKKERKEGCGTETSALCLA